MRAGSILLAVGSLLGFILIFEGTIRLVRPDLTLPSDPSHFRFSQENTTDRPHHVRDDVLGWRLKPNQETGIRTNSRGYRTPEFDTRKTPGTFRLLFLGDSNPFGFDLADEEAPYPRRVDAILTEYLARFGLENPPRIEAINLAVDGYSSYQVRILVDEVIDDLRPDVIAIQVGFNDHCLSVMSDRDHRFRRPWLLGGLEHSHAYRWLRRQILSLARPGSRLVDPVPRVSPDDYADNIRAIVRRCHAAGAATLLLTTPARPTTPLVSNEVPADRDGRVVWMTQEAWISSRFEAAGFLPPYTPATPRFLEIVATVSREHPEWPLPHYMLAATLRKLGREAEAEGAESAWRRNDRERIVLRGYADRLRRVAAEEGALAVNVGQLLKSFTRDGGEAAMGSLFLDFVHLTDHGHVVVATEIARLIATNFFAADSTSLVRRWAPTK